MLQCQPLFFGVGAARPAPALIRPLAYFFAADLNMGFASGRRR